jgi:hypothetical protein
MNLPSTKRYYSAYSNHQRLNSGDEKPKAQQKEPASVRRKAKQQRAATAELAILWGIRRA